MWSYAYEANRVEGALNDRLLTSVPHQLTPSTVTIWLDSCTHCAQSENGQGEAPLTVLSLALPGPSQRDRFPSRRHMLPESP